MAGLGRTSGWVDAVAATGSAAPALTAAWVPDARDELLATARRISDEHAVSIRRVASDHARYEETRLASQALRRRTERERRARAADRALRLTTPRAPAAPSAG